MSDRIPFLDLSGEMKFLGDSLYAAVRGVMESKQFILGPSVAAFEEEVRDYLGVKHAVSVNSGTDALIIGLRAAGIGAGDEVITTPFTYVATAGAISLVGAHPVFVDIDPETCNINSRHLEQAVTSRTKAIVPVHLFGRAADMDTILAVARDHDLVVLEDSAQAIGGEYQGKKLGTLGNVGAFSFFPTKNLGACGDGGLIVTNDDGVAEASRMLRVHGSRQRYHSEAIGYNSRLDAIQAAILRVKLPHLDTFNEKRRRVARRYGELLSGLPNLELPAPSPEKGHVYHQYTVRVPGDARDKVRSRLDEAGIATMVYYPKPVHQFPQYLGETALPHAERACREVLSLPIWPDLPAAWQERIAREVRKVLQSTHVQENA